MLLIGNDRVWSIGLGGGSVVAAACVTARGVVLVKKLVLSEHGCAPLLPSDKASQVLTDAVKSDYRNLESLWHFHKMQ